MLFWQVNTGDGRTLDQVEITGMLLSCVIGIFPFERKRKQPVNVDICLYLDTRKAAKSTNITDTIDYSGALQEISFILEQCEFLLIETAVEAVCKHFLITYQADHALPTIDAVSVRISKPSALARGVIPSVQVLRRRDDYKVEALEGFGCKLYNIHDTPATTLDLFVADGTSELKIFQRFKEARTVLPIGRWQFDKQDVKPRTPISLSPDFDHTFRCNEPSSKGPKILLIHSEA
jgi:FolB domain-containing protein